MTYRWNRRAGLILCFFIALALFSLLAIADAVYAYLSEVVELWKEFRKDWRDTALERSE